MGKQRFRNSGTRKKVEEGKSSSNREVARLLRIRGRKRNWPGLWQNLNAGRGEKNESVAM